MEDIAIGIHVIIRRRAEMVSWDSWASAAIHQEIFSHRPNQQQPSLNDVCYPGHRMPMIWPWRRPKDRNSPWWMATSEGDYRRTSAMKPSNPHLRCAEMAIVGSP